MKDKLKIAVWGHFPGDSWTKTHRVLRLLSRKYNVEVSDDPDLMFIGDEWFKYSGRVMHNCLKVFMTGENAKPNFHIADYAFTFEDTDDKNFQLPHFARYDHLEELRTGRFSEKTKKYRARPKSKFCLFLFSNPQNQERIKFCKKLMSYKRVDCPGAVLRNMPRLRYDWGNDFDFASRYKFSIAFENISAVHYTTEKILRSLAVGSIPIYWGNPRIAEYFNPDAFINCHDYDNFDQTVKWVIEVDNDDALYKKYLDAPAILENSKAYAITDEAIMERLDKIVNSIGVVTPVLQKWPHRLLFPLYILRSRWQISARLKRLVGRLLRG